MVSPTERVPVPVLVLPVPPAPPAPGRPPPGPPPTATTWAEPTGHSWFAAQKNGKTNVKPKAKPPPPPAPSGVRPDDVKQPQANRNRNPPDVKSSPSSSSSSPSGLPQYQYYWYQYECWDDSTDGVRWQMVEEENIALLNLRRPWICLNQEWFWVDYRHQYEDTSTRMSIASKYLHDYPQWQHTQTVRSVSVTVIKQGEDRCQALPYAMKDHEIVDMNGGRVVWQVRLDKGWRVMQEAASIKLSDAALTSNRDSQTTFEHHWRCPWNKSKRITNYEVNFERMVQTNPDSKKEREIRVVKITPDTSFCCYLYSYRPAPTRTGGYSFAPTSGIDANGATEGTGTGTSSSGSVPASTTGVSTSDQFCTSTASTANTGSTSVLFYQYYQ